MSVYERSRWRLLFVRGIIAVGILVLIVLAFTPYCWPTYGLAVCAMGGLWRYGSNHSRVWRVLLEGWLLGCLACWLVTQFFSGAVQEYWLPMHWLCCSVVGLQTGCLAGALWMTRLWTILPSALATAAVAVVGELVQAKLIGITWVATNVSLTMVETPVAQWSQLVSPFGLTFLVVGLGCLSLPECNETGYRRWQTTFGAAGLIAILWQGGLWLESRVAVGAPPVVALLVQPACLPGGEPDGLSSWITLHELTQDSLQTAGPVDLVLWPESCLADTAYARVEQLNCEDDAEHASEQQNAQVHSAELTSPISEAVNLPVFYRQLLPQYVSACLVGVCLSVSSSQEKYGLTVPTVERYNCGCLVAAQGEIHCHEKLAVMPLREGFPGWFNQHWVRDLVPPRPDGSRPNIVSGRGFNVLNVRDSEGQTKKIAVAICYESWFPWLPQYHCKEPLDAICHLAYDGDFKDHPEYTQRMLLTIRLRAIETRTWQLVCSHYAGTAVIDPRGRIVKQLPPGPGVLRTDQLE